MDPDPRVAADALRWRRRLRALLAERGRSIRSVERELGWSEGYLSQLLRGSPELRVWHVLAVLDAIEMPAAEFFGGLYGPSRARTRAPEPIGESREGSSPAEFEELWQRLGEMIRTRVGAAAKVSDRKD